MPLVHREGVVAAVRLADARLKGSSTAAVATPPQQAADQLQEEPLLDEQGNELCLKFAGLLRGKPLLKYLLQAAYDGLSEEGWRKLSRNWALFFVAMAVANELMRRSMSFDAWLAVKVWGVTIVSVVFAGANIPMLLRHGLTLDDGLDSDEVGETTPPQG